MFNVSPESKNFLRNLHKHEYETINAEFIQSCGLKGDRVHGLDLALHSKVTPHLLFQKNKSHIKLKKSKWQKSKEKDLFRELEIINSDTVRQVIKTLFT